jgi:molybdate transport system substrate-binding protein
MKVKFTGGLISVLLTAAILMAIIAAGCGSSESSSQARRQIKRFQDLASPGVKIAIGDPELAPVGKYTVAVLENIGEKDGDLKQKIDKNIVTREPNVRAILDKVVNREVDAGFVYITDAMIEKDRICVIEIPEEVQVVSEYPVCVLKESDNKPLAEVFFKYVLARQGQEVLKKYGFVPAVKDPAYFKPGNFQGQTLVVFAAASLTNAFFEMGKSFEQKTGVKVKFQFGASGTLRQKIEGGAVGGEGGADVFAAAGMKDAEILREKGLSGDMAPFVKNKLVVITPKN